MYYYERRRRVPEWIGRAWRDTVETLQAILVASLLMLGLLAFLGCLYVLKRELGIDVVPGVDMLPDELIEGFLWSLFG